MLDSRYLTPRGDRPAALALGCMNFGRRTPKPDALRIIDRAIDAGIPMLDTANMYTDGESERIVGEAVRGRRDSVLIATKAGIGRGGGANEGLARGTLLAACDASLQRLGVETIDLYYLHTPDPKTPFAETVGALGELLAAGKIRAWAISNFASWQILELTNTAHALGLPGPVAAQQIYNAFVRQLDVEYFAYARSHPIHTTIYNPLAGGLLAGGLHFADAPPRGSRFDKHPWYRGRYWRRALFDALVPMREVAGREGMSLLELAYTFALGTPGVDSVLVGPGTVEHLKDAIVASRKRLSPEGHAAMDEIHKDLVGTDARYAR